MLSFVRQFGIVEEVIRIATPQRRVRDMPVFGAEVSKGNFENEVLVVYASATSAQTALSRAQWSNVRSGCTDARR